jgi:hypothetical protein
MTQQGPPDMEKSLGHWMCSNPMVVWILLVALVSAGVVWGTTLTVNAQEHDMFRKEMANARQWRNGVDRTFLDLNRTLGRIESKVNLNMIGGAR